MGRKNLSEERTAEILAAFARCLVKYGLDTSLDQVADEAGMTRSIIRHYIGNREAVIEALIEQITRDYITALQTTGDLIPLPERIDALLDYLFTDLAAAAAYDKLIIDVLLTAHDRYPTAKAHIVAMLDTLVAMFADDLRAAYPAADAARCQDVAYSVLCLAMNHDSFMSLGMAAARAAHGRGGARRCADALIDTIRRVP
jgi:AcrR family transcriptional regulator